MSAPRCRVLVLLASCNGEAWIEEQLASVLAQSGVVVEIHVFDDVSSDRTVEIVRAIAANDARLRSTSHDIRSGSAGANFRRAIEAADLRNVTHVAFCDQDDVWDADKLDVACRALAASHADLYSSAVTAVWPNGKRRQLRQSSRIEPSDFLFEGAGQGCTFVMTTEFFARVQAFVTSHRTEVAAIHYHDWLVYALARTWGRRWTYDRDAHLSYRQHPDNDTGARGKLAGVRRRLTLIRSGWYARQTLAMISVCSIAGGVSAEIARVRALMAAARRSPGGRLAWSTYLLVRGRRRFVDRAVLCVAAACGYL